MPLSAVKNVKTSFLPFVEVIDGAEPLAHFTESGQAIVLAVPSAVSININPVALLEVAGALLIVKDVTEAFKLTLNIVELDRSKVSAPVEIVGALTVSTIVLKSAQLLNVVLPL